MIQTGGHDTLRRYVRIAAIALAILGVLALGHDRASAQIGLDMLRQVIDKGKSKTGKDATELLKGKKSRQKGTAQTDAVKDRLKNKGGLEKGARDKVTKEGLTKDRLTKDRLPKDQLTKDRGGKDRLTKDRLTKDAAKDKGGRDKLTKDKGTTRDKSNTKDKNIAKDKSNTKDKTVGKDKSGAKDKAIAKDKSGAKDKTIAKDKGGAKDKTIAKDKGGRDKVGKDRTAIDKGGKGRATNPKTARSKTVPERRPVQRFAKAKSPVERSKLRVQHRREIFASRQRLPPRPFPGTAAFTGVPPAGETRFRSTEMVFHAGPNVSRQSVEAAAKRHGMVIVATQPSGITGGTVYVCEVPGGVGVATAVGAMEGEGIGVASPNYVYVISQEAQEPASDTQSGAGSSDQYIVEKLNLAEVHKVATGRDIRVAVIDSKVDVNHPDLAGAIAEQYDAVGRPEQAHTHGTGMTGAIVSHRKLLGVAPNARILAVHAFSTSTRQSPEATTRQIIAGIEWAINNGARIINMSFAGPYDPLLQLAMRNAHDKGVILIAASGNMGPKSPPLYPAADPHVIAVTATDESDEQFPQAVRGPHVDVAAPGVDVIVPAPDDGYQLTTGTSVAAAHVSGVAALLLERHPTATAEMIQEVLTATARNLNPKGRDDIFGWGLIDPQAALQELDSRIADGKTLATTKAAPKPNSKSTPPATAAARPATPKTTSPAARPTPTPAAAR